MPKPKDIWSRFHYLRDTVYASAREKMRKDEEYYLGRIKGFELPEEMQGRDGSKLALIPPLAKSIVETPVNRINLRYPTFKVAGDNQKLRDFALGFYQTIIPQVRQWATYDFSLGAMDALILALSQMPFAAISKRAGEPDKDFAVRMQSVWAAKGITSPFFVRCPHPSNVLYDTSPTGPTYVFEVQERLTYDVLREFPKYLPGQNETVEFVTYFDDEYFGYFVGEQALLKGEFQKHGYGFIPYTRALAGYGTDTYDRKPEDQIQGLIRGSLDTIWAATRTMNQALTIQDRTAWPSPVTDDPDAQLNFGLSEITRVSPGSKVWNAFPEFDVAPLWQTFGLLSGMAYEAGAPGPLRGIAVEGSGNKNAMVQAAGQQQYEYAYQSLERLVGRVIMQAASLLVNGMVGPVDFWGEFPDKDGKMIHRQETITAEDLKPPFHITVKFEALSPEERDRKAIVGMQMGGIGQYPSDRPAIPEESARRDYMGRTNPEEDAKQIRRDQLRQSPAVAQLAQQWLAEKLQRAHEKHEMEEMLRELSHKIPNKSIASVAMPIVGAPPGGVMPGQPPPQPPFVGEGMAGQTGETQPVMPGGPFQLPPPPGSYERMRRGM